MATNEEIIETIGNMTVNDLCALTKAIETKFNVKASAKPIEVITPVEKVEEQTEFSVVITEVPADKKIAVIKTVRSLIALGLKESKEMVESLPATVKKDVEKAEATTTKTQLEAAGATVIIK